MSVHLSANADPAASALCVAMQLQARKGVALQPQPTVCLSTVLILLPTVLNFLSLLLSHTHTPATRMLPQQGQAVGLTHSALEWVPGSGWGLSKYFSS